MAAMKVIALGASANQLHRRNPLRLLRLTKTKFHFSPLRDVAAVLGSSTEIQGIGAWHKRLYNSAVRVSHLY
jgi:hypothetical protein